MTLRLAYPFKTLLFDSYPNARPIVCFQSQERQGRRGLFDGSLLSVNDQEKT